MELLLRVTWKDLPNWSFTEINYFFRYQKHYNDVSVWTMNYARPIALKNNQQNSEG